MALFEDMGRAWRLRAEMSYKSLKDNLFIVTFNAEGDHKFVLQGGPWIHRGDALIVADFNGLLSPSMVPLESVPIWVRIYDLPLVMMNKARGELYGSKLGKVTEEDVQQDGSNKHDFFRIRVDLPVNRPLKRQIAIKIKIKGAEEIRRFNLRYERVPHFCFFCGFIGHSDKECEKRLANEAQPLMFSADLRCSPLKAFERKISKVKANQSAGVQRKLVFRGAGSASSSSARNKQGDYFYTDPPTRIDAYDGFDSREEEGDELVDAQLAEKAGSLHMSDSTLSRKNQTNKFSAGDELASLPSFEMIPAIRNLGTQQESTEDVSNEATISPIKRKGSDNAQLKIMGKVQQALLEFDQSESQGGSGQGKTGAPARASKRFKKDEKAENTAVDMEATSPRATGKLARPMAGSRQEQ